MSWVGPGRAWPRSRACLKIGRAGMFDVGTGVLIDDSTRVGHMSKGGGGFPRAGAHFQDRDAFLGLEFASTVTAFESRSILEGDDHRNVIGSSLAFAFVTFDLRGRN